MSYFDDASLVMIPSGYKTSKVYSVKPTDGTGDLTFTRSNDTATRVNSAGLIEKVRTNLVLQSNTFDTTWVNTGSTETGGQSGYDGTNNAWLLDINGNIDSQRISQSISASGSLTLSVYAKAGTKNWTRLFCAGTSTVSAYFDLQNGALGTATNCTSKIEAAGNGYYRCSVSFNTTITDVRIYIATGDLNVVQTSGNILIQSAQLETGDIATDYIETTTAALSVGPVANVPRLDYLNSSCPRLLLEPQRQNVWLFSEQANNAAWSNVEDTTVSANVGTSPDGYVNADKLIPQATSNLHRVSQAFTVTASTPYTFSVFVKRDGYDYFLIRTGDGTNNNVGYDLLNGTVTFEASGYTGFIQSYGNEWYRIGYVRSFAGTSASIFLRPNPTIVNFSSIPAFTGDGTSGALVWGAQLEAGAYATSYIPTLGAAVTRGQDSAENTSASSIIGQTEGTMFVQVGDFPKEFNGRIMAISQNSSNYITILKNGDYNDFYTLCAVGGATQMSYQGTGSLSDNAKIAVAYANNDFVIYVNGTQVHTDTSGNVPTCSNLFIGKRENGTVTYSTGGSVSQALLFPTRLPNSSLAELTSL